MKKIMVFALLITLSLMTTQSASAQPTGSGRYATAGYSLLITACNVNGVIFPVDSYAQIWAVNNFGQWVIIGHLTFGPPTGYVAVRLDGVTFPAYCS
jgi:hypothetical protein